MTLTLRYMRPSDIARVVDIDKQSFPTPWSARSYQYEVKESNYSHMLVLEALTEQPATGWRRLIRGFSKSANGQSESPPMERKRTMVGYGGLWHIMEEAHISTIATAPEARGQGYGELLLSAMVKRSITLGASYVVLEVRVSNLVAKRLYEKYAFSIVDTKRNYYRDNGEDAYDMRLDLEDSATVASFEVLFAQVKQRQQFIDEYSQLKRKK